MHFMLFNLRYIFWQVIQESKNCSFKHHKKIQNKEKLLVIDRKRKRKMERNFKKEAEPRLLPQEHK